MKEQGIGRRQGHGVSLGPVIIEQARSPIYYK